MQANSTALQRAQDAARRVVRAVVVLRPTRGSPQFSRDAPLPLSPYPTNKAYPAQFSVFAPMAVPSYPASERAEKGQTP